MSDEYNASDFKRKYERKTYKAEIYFSVKSQAYPATIHNLSLGGALIKHDGTLKISEGETITINIPFSNTERGVKRKARIMWISDTKFGIEFI